MDPFSSKQKIARSRILYFSRGFEELVQEHECCRSMVGARLSRDVSPPCLPGASTFEEARQLRTASAVMCEQIPNSWLLRRGLARCGECETAIEIAEHFKLFSIDSPISGLRQAIGFGTWRRKGAIVH